MRLALFLMLLVITIYPAENIKHPGEIQMTLGEGIIIINDNLSTKICRRKMEDNSYEYSGQCAGKKLYNDDAERRFNKLFVSLNKQKESEATPRHESKSPFSP